MLTRVLRGITRRWRGFPGSIGYWEQRYRSGGNSGIGSYGRLAQFKARVLNAFVAEHAVRSVIEFGCGDGNQLSLACYPRYIGLDVAPTAIQLCKARFGADRTKSFFRYDPECFVDPLGVFRAELALSLDVVFHLVEEPVFGRYFAHLFAAAERFVIIYSTDRAIPASPAELHRPFTPHVDRCFPDWTLLKRIPNAYPWSASEPNDTSAAEFYIYQRRCPTGS